MTQVYFLIPGLLLPEAARPFLSAETLAVAGRITRAAAATPSRRCSLPALRQQVCIWRGSGGCLRESPCRLPQLPTPGLWIRGRNFRAKSGACTLLTMTARHLRTWTGRITNDAAESLAQLLRAPLDQAGFVLQRWDQTFYLTRKTDWGVEAAAWPCCAQESLTGIAPWPRALMRRPTHYRKRRKR